MNRLRILNLTILAGAIAVAVVCSYLLGSYCTYKVCALDADRYRVYLNSMYLLITDQDGDRQAIHRMISQTNEAAANIDQSRKFTIEPFLKLAILGQPMVTSDQLRPAAWALATYQKRHPESAFPLQTTAFIDRFPARHE